MSEGEELLVIELDQGDGWTRVRRLCGPNGWEEGFVPTSYIESTLYAQVSILKFIAELLCRRFDVTYSGGILKTAEISSKKKS